MWASFEVKSTGSSTKLTAQLRVGGSSGTVAYPLTGSDELLVSIDGADETNLDETCEEDNTFCTGNLGDISGKDVKVNFERGSAAENAPNSVVTMPKAFKVSVKDDEVVRGEEDVLLSITGGSSRLAYRASGDCIWTEDGVISDGMIPKAAIRSRGSKASEDCDVTVVVTRTAEGDLDPNFGKGGRIVAVQERKFTFFSLANPNPADEPDAGDTSTSDTSSVSSSAPDAGDSGLTEPDDGGVSSEVPDAASTDGGSDSTVTGDGGSSTAVSSDADAGSSSAPADAGDAG